MKILLSVALIHLSFFLPGQTIINKSIPISSDQNLSIEFDYPDLIKINTWDKNEINIIGEVSINNGENDDAFELITITKGNTVTIKNKIRNMDTLPQKITIVDGSQKIMFKSKADFKKYKEEHGNSYDMVSWGVDIDIVIEIKIPKNTMTHVTSVYGMVEVKDFQAPLQVMAKYGGVDASLNTNAVGELSVETNYGQIYSNLDIKFASDNIREKDFYTYVTAKPGTGPRYDFESIYGNVYLRRVN